MPQVLTYFHLQIFDVASEDEDAISSLCFDFGAEGVAENLSFHQNNETYEPVTLETNVHHLNVYFNGRPEEEFFLKIQTQFPNVRVELSEEKNQDWMAEWKKGFKAFPLVANIWVVPSWLPAPQEAQSIIRIDPGMAFGTGTHETTQLAAEFLFEKFKGGRLLDVGTGTGILAMLAQHLGARAVIGTEIDEHARSVGQENIMLNKMDVASSLRPVSIIEEQIDSLNEDFEWVVANIIDGVLIKIKSDLLRVSQKDMILTGILIEREKEFVQKWLEGGQSEIISRKQKGEWVGFHLKRL